MRLGVGGMRWLRDWGILSSCGMMELEGRKSEDDGDTTEI